MTTPAPHTHPAERETPAGEAMREAVAHCECGAEIDPQAVFEPGVCDPCSARRFNEEAAAHRNPAPPPIPVRARFYMICCEHCDWVGSSEQCGADAGFDDSDVYCPVCCQSMLCEEPSEADTAKHGQAVFDRIAAAEAALATQRADHAAEVARKDAEIARLIIAFHDAIRRPLGVTPDSGAEFYDCRMADEAEARRADLAPKETTHV